MLSIIWWIIVGLIAGFITGKIMKGGGYGTLMDIVIGIVGAIIGGFIMRAVGFAGSGGMIYTILVAILGAVILTWLLRLVTGNRASNLYRLPSVVVTFWVPHSCRSFIAAWVGFTHAPGICQIMVRPLSRPHHRS